VTRIAENLGDAKVRQDHVPVLVEHHIGGFDVPVGHAMAVSVRECRGYVFGDANRFWQRHDLILGSQLLQLGVQGVAVDTLHDDVKVYAVGRVKVVRLHDVGVTELSARFGFALEPGQKVLVFGEEGVQELDGDVPIQRGLIGLVDFGHGASPDQFHDLIFAECFSDE